jgi:hypothetical protein
MDWKRVGCVQPTTAQSGCTGLSGGAPDSVWCARPVSVNRPLSGLDGGVRLQFTGLSGGASDCPVSRPRRTRCSREENQRRTDKIHRTVRWCTELSGEPTVDCANGRPCNLRATRGHANGRQGAPDCPVCTEQCPVRQLPRICNGRMRQKRKEITHRTTTVTVRWRTGLSGAPPDRRQD